MNQYAIFDIEGVKGKIEAAAAVKAEEEEKRQREEEAAAEARAAAEAQAAADQRIADEAGANVTAGVGQRTDEAEANVTAGSGTEVQLNSQEDVPQSERRVTINESANQVIPIPQSSAGDTSRTGDAEQGDIASQGGGPVAGRVDAVNVTEVEGIGSATGSATGSAPPPPAQSLRVATVSTRAYTSSGSVSDALERIKEALIEKKEKRE